MTWKQMLIDESQCKKICNENNKGHPLLGSAILSRMAVY